MSWHLHVWQIQQIHLTIPQCIRQIPHNAPFCNRNVHTYAHFCYKNGALWDTALIHCGICEIGLLQWLLKRKNPSQYSTSKLVECLWAFPQYWNLKVILCTHSLWNNPPHYSDVIMTTMASQITSVSLVYSAVGLGVDQRKHQSSASLAFVRGIHRWPGNSPHKGPVKRKMVPFDNVNMPWNRNCKKVNVLSVWS